MAQSGVSGVASPSQSTDLFVDAQLVEVREAAHDSPAHITGDIHVYNGDSDMEISIEGLTVGSLASSHPDADRDLYLYTKFDLDPEAAIVQNCSILDDNNTADGICDEVLEESIQRVQAFYNETPDSAAAWPAETEEHQTTCIVKQIAHKYPRMSVLSLTDSVMGISTPILNGLGSAFVGYTSVELGPLLDKSFDRSLAQSPAAVKSKVSRLNFFSQTSDNTQNQLDEIVSSASSQPYDLVILSTSIFKQAAPSEAVLDKMKLLMRPGGFLVVLHMPVKTMRDQDQGPASFTDSIITPPDWPDLLDQHGFMNPAIQNTDQHYPGGFSITVQQRDSFFKESVAQLSGPLSFPVPAFFKLNDRLLVVGGESHATSSLAARVSELLSSHFNNPIVTVSGLDELADFSTEHLLSFNCMILLSDLDDSQPVLSSLNERRLDTLRKLVLRPESIMLWVTKGSHAGNAENAASYGFTRSIRAEMPSLVLQMLDFERLDAKDGQLMVPCETASTSCSAAASIVADTFFKLMLEVKEKEKRGQSVPSTLDSSQPQDEVHVDPLWTLENELFIDRNGQRLISRMLPFKPSNDNFNALRRVVTKRVNTLSSCVELVRDATHDTYQAFTSPYPVPSVSTVSPSADGSVSGQVHVRAHYSSTMPFLQGHYVVMGQCIETGNAVLSASKINSSVVSVSAEHLVTIGTVDDHEYAKNGRSYAASLVHILVYLHLRRAFAAKQLVILEPDGMLQGFSKHFFQHMKDGFLAVVQVASDTSKEAGSPYLIHPRDSAFQIASKLYRFGDGAAIVSFLPKEHLLSKRLPGTMPPGYSYHSWADFVADMERHTLGSDFVLNARHLQEALETTRRVVAADPGYGLSGSFVSVPSLLASPRISLAHSLGIVDWRAERVVECKVHPHEANSDVIQVTSAAGSATRLRGDRTYVLIGITRDMGQSLSALFIKQGARHIVLASRSVVSVEPQWAKHARSMLGVDVRFEVLDVTDLAAVEQFRARVEQRMPRIGGIINGAMVLNDQVFAQMKAETFSRVMRPKTVGSRYLDAVFHDEDEDDDNKLEFFIMTSSFAAMGGHAGQSNYAAANMYMNGVAANRQRRGVAGSVLNIGVVYGLGFLHREKGELYAGLEREGYPPISERDLHHMFLEAIAYGRPKTDAVARDRPIVDFTAGLSRFDPHQAPEDALHWHKDPRFSHFTIHDNEASGSGRASGKAGGGADNSSTQQLLDAIGDETATAETISPRLVSALSERLATLLHLDLVTSSGDAANSDSNKNGNGGSIRGDSSMIELGVDSLVAVEMRTWLWRTTGRDVPVMKILGAASIDRLCKEIASEIVAARGP
ncbi:MAG: putative secondary metabolism biosynthetic enzyme [Sporothrix thermara]